MNLIYISLVGVILFLLIYFVLRPRKPKPICPECGHKHCDEIGREQLDFTTYQRLRNPHGGVDTMVKSKYKLSFRCQNCDTVFTEIISETR